MAESAPAYDLHAHLVAHQLLTNIFVLRSLEQGTDTIARQQERALALAAALLEESAGERPTVAVIGAGVGGLTVAAALALAGWKICVFERAPVILPLFRNASHRYIHPSIGDWPKIPDHENPEHFRYGPLTWCARPASQVADQLAEAFFKLQQCPGICLRTVTGTRIVGSSSDSSSQRGAIVRRFDDIKSEFCRVILSVGYGQDGVPRGTEPKIPGDDSPPYWEPDSLQRIEWEGPRRILIGGAGDGALTEVCRATIVGIHHEQIVQSVINRDRFRRATSLMSFAEEEIERLRGRGVRPTPYDYIEAAPKEWRYIADELERVFSWNSTQVTLVARNGLQPNCQAINRFLTIAMCAAGRLEFVAGSVERVYRSDNGRIVLIKLAGVGHDTKEVPLGPFDGVCLRMGLPEGVTDAIRSVLPETLWNRAEDMGRTQPSAASGLMSKAMRVLTKHWNGRLQGG